MLLQYSSSSFRSVALFLVLSFRAFISASPIETSLLSDVSLNPLDKRMPANPRDQRKCSDIFGSPVFADCAGAIGNMPHVNNAQNAINRAFFGMVGDQSGQLPAEHVPRIYVQGTCLVELTTMKAIKEGHFGFIVGDIPVGTSDHATWGQVNDVSNQLNAGCVQEKRLGGIQRAGQNLNLAVIIYGQGLYYQLQSTLYGTNFFAGPGRHQLVPVPGATA